MKSFILNPQTIGPSSKIYWTRFSLGIIAALICFALNIRGSDGIFMAIIIYMFSYIIFKNIFRYGEKELKGKHKLVTLGAGTYIFTWAALWILLYTLENS